MKVKKKIQSNIEQKKKKTGKKKEARSTTSTCDLCTHLPYTIIHMSNAGTWGYPPHITRVNIHGEPTVRGCGRKRKDFYFFIFFFCCFKKLPKPTSLWRSRYIEGRRDWTWRCLLLSSLLVVAYNNLESLKERWTAVAAYVKQ